MRSLLIKQAIVIPLAAMLVPILIAFFLPGYSSISQHISETALLDHPIAYIQRTVAIVTGASIFLFGVGVYLSPQRAAYTAIMAMAFGVSMISNGVIVMGSHLHGLYGLGLVTAGLVPAFFAAEFHETDRSHTLVKLSLLVAAITQAYWWLMLSGFDPTGFRGLTQRLFTVICFGWYSVVSYFLIYRPTLPSTKQPSSFVDTPAAG